MGATSSVGMWRSAGCRYRAGVSLYSAHTGAIEGPLLYRKYGCCTCTSLDRVGGVRVCEANCAIERGC